MTKTMKICSFLIIFDHIRPIFDTNQTTFDINGLDLNQIVARSLFGPLESDRKSCLKTI